MCQAIIVSDKYAALAKAMLQALKDSETDLSAYFSFPEFPDIPVPVRDAQHALLKALYEDGHLSSEQSSCSYVEPGCVEHNIVHIQVCDGCSNHTHWLGVCPDDGSIEIL